MNLPDHVRLNKASWESEAANYVEPAKRNWAGDEISWGMCHVPESEVAALPEVDGMDVVELGCGTAYFSAWLARRGARPTGVDITENQLATARAMQAEHGLDFPLSRRAPRTCRSLLVALTSPSSGTNSERLVHGFAVTGLHELYAPSATETSPVDWMPVEWAKAAASTYGSDECRLVLRIGG